MQHSGLIAQPTVCLIRLSTGSHSSDTGLEHSAPQLRFTRCTICSSSAKSPSLSAALLYFTRPESPWQDRPFLAVCWSYIALIALLEPSTLYQSVLEFAISFYSAPANPRNFSLLVRMVSCVPADLTSEASRIATLLGVVTLCYNM